jgi:hypothetical protein
MTELELYENTYVITINSMYCVIILFISILWYLHYNYSNSILELKNIIENQQNILNSKIIKCDENLVEKDNKIEEIKNNINYEITQSYITVEENIKNVKDNIFNTLDSVLIQYNEKLDKFKYYMDRELNERDNRIKKIKDNNYLLEQNINDIINETLIKYNEKLDEIKYSIDNEMKENNYLLEQNINNMMDGVYVPLYYFNNNNDYDGSICPISNIGFCNKNIVDLDINITRGNGNSFMEHVTLINEHHKSVYMSGQKIVFNFHYLTNMKTFKIYYYYEGLDLEIKLGDFINTKVEEIYIKGVRKINFKDIHKLQFLKSIVIENPENKYSEIKNVDDLIDNIPECDKFKIVLHKCVSIDKLKLIKNVVIR